MTSGAERGATRVKKLRAKRGISQETLAEKIGLNRLTITRLEAAAHPPQCRDAGQDRPRPPGHRGGPGEVIKEPDARSPRSACPGPGPAYGRGCRPRAAPWAVRSATRAARR